MVIVPAALIMQPVRLPVARQLLINLMALVELIIALLSPHRLMLPVLWLAVLLPAGKLMAPVAELIIAQQLLLLPM